MSFNLSKVVRVLGRIITPTINTLFISGVKNWYTVPALMTLADMLQTTGVPGALVQLSDYDSPLWQWSETEQRWKLTGEWNIIQDVTVRTLTSTNTTADTNAVVMAQYSIPPGVVCTGSRIRMRWLYGGGAGTATAQKICYLRINGMGSPSGNLAASNVFRQAEINLYCTTDSTQIMANSDAGPAGISNANALIARTEDIRANGMVFNIEAKFATQVAGEFIVVHRLEVSITP